MSGRTKRQNIEAKNVGGGNGESKSGLSQLPWSVFPVPEAGVGHDVAEVELVCLPGTGDAMPPSTSEHTGKAMLNKVGITAKLQMRLYSSDKDVATSLALDYINRGQCRDVFGDGRIAVKLQMMEDHDGSNGKEAASLLEHEGHPVPRLLWCGRARLTESSWGAVQLSCLVVLQQGEDLMNRIRRLARDGRKVRAHCIRSQWECRWTVKAALEFFVLCWHDGIFLKDYGLRQVCIRAGVTPRVNEQGVEKLEASDLVMVDAEDILMPRDCGPSRIGKIWKPIVQALELALAQLGLGLPEVTLKKLCELLDKNIMQAGLSQIVEWFEDAWTTVKMEAPVRPVVCDLHRLLTLVVQAGMLIWCSCLAS